MNPVRVDLQKLFDQYAEITGPADQQKYDDLENFTDRLKDILLGNAFFKDAESLELALKEVRLQAEICVANAPNQASGNCSRQGAYTGTRCIKCVKI